MKNKWVSLVKSAVAVACLATASVNAFAMPILVESGGQVVGIDGLMVGAETYDVQFVEGSCDSLFSGCDQSLFTFTTQARAMDAAGSILSAFAGTPVDRFPELQLGIELQFLGVTFIPYATSSGGLVVTVVEAANAGAFLTATDAVSSGTPIPSSQDTSLSSSRVYATFLLATPDDAPPAIPTPASLLLALFGLAGMRLQHKRQRRQV